MFFFAHAHAQTRTDTHTHNRRLPTSKVGPAVRARTVHTPPTNQTPFVIRMVTRRHNTNTSCRKTFPTNRTHRLIVTTPHNTQPRLHRNGYSGVNGDKTKLHRISCRCANHAPQETTIMLQPDVSDQNIHSVFFGRAHNTKLHTSTLVLQDKTNCSPIALINRHRQHNSRTNVQNTHRKLRARLAVRVLHITITKAKLLVQPHKNTKNKTKKNITKSSHGSLSLLEVSQEGGKW